MPLTVQEIADFAHARLTNATGVRFFGKQDKEYVNSEHVDFSIDDAIIRMSMNNHLKVEFTVPAADVQASRQTIYTKYAQPAFEQFFNDFQVLKKAYVVSVPIMPMADPGRIVARNSNNGLHVIASALRQPNNDYLVTVEILFGALNL